jgi:hypothetical protein
MESFVGWEARSSPAPLGAGAPPPRGGCRSREKEVAGSSGEWGGAAARLAGEEREEKTSRRQPRGTSLLARSSPLLGRIP